MPNYVQKQLNRYDWKRPKRPQYCPYEPNPEKYGARSDEIIQEKESPLLDKEEKKFIQQVVGSFCIMHVLSTLIFLPPSEKLLGNRQNQLKTQ